MSRGDTRDTTRSTGGGDWKMNGQAIMNGPSGRPSKEIGVSSGGGDADIHSVGGTVNTLLQPHLDDKIRIPEVTQGASQSRLPFRRDGELNRQAAWDEHIPDEFLQLKPSENADELTADGTHRDEELEPVTLEKIFKLNLGRERPQPDQAKVENICMLKTHKTASTTLGSILFRYASRLRTGLHVRPASGYSVWPSGLCTRMTHLPPILLASHSVFRFAAKNHLSVYNREGHELKKWRFWFEGDIDEPVHKYNMVITHYGKSTGTRRETWYTNDKPDDSNDDTEQDDSGATAVSIPVSAPATDIDVQDQEEEEDQEEDQDEQKEEEQEEEQGEEKRGDTPASRGLMSAAGPVVEGDEEDHQEEEEADSKNPVSDSQATEESLPGDIAEISSPDADAVAPAQQQVYRDITLQNFTDWCSSVVRPSSSDATFRTITTIREPVGHFLSWYFFYIEPELTYNFGDERFAADDGSATANGTHQDDGHGDDDDGDPGGWYASRAAVADRLYLWMQWHGTDPNGDVPADAKNETDVVQVLDEEDETVGDNKTVSLDNTFNHQAREFLLWSDVHVQEFLDMHEQRMTDSNSSNLLDFVMLADRYDCTDAHVATCFLTTSFGLVPDRFLSVCLSLSAFAPNQIRRILDRPQAHAELGHERPYVFAHVERRWNRQQTSAPMGRTPHKE